jgi:hypothetical protein
MQVAFVSAGRSLHMPLTVQQTYPLEQHECVFMRGFADVDVSTCSVYLAHTCVHPCWRCRAWLLVYGYSRRDLSQYIPWYCGAFPEV